LIVIICGLPGVGKSTLAKNLAPMINSTILSSDKIRKELFPNPTYSSFERKLVYDIMVILAKYLTEAGCNCILDATFNREDSRLEIREKLHLDDREFQIVECLCPEEVVISRLKSRKDEYSDATMDTYKKMKNIYEPVKSGHISVDTVLSPQENSQRIVEAIKRKTQIT
jgi:predicted kinase